MTYQITITGNGNSFSHTEYILADSVEDAESYAQRLAAIYEQGGGSYSWSVS